jgi:hypothetical protein
MPRFEEIDRILAGKLPEFRAQFGVRGLGIFGVRFVA